MREGVGVAISGLKCTPRLGLGPRYNAERPPRPITYPPPPPLLILYNPKRGTPCSGHLKIVPSEGAGVQKRDPQNTRQTPSKHLQNTFKTPKENLSFCPLLSAPRARLSLRWALLPALAPLCGTRRSGAWVSTLLLSWAVRRTPVLRPIRPCVAVQ